ncbi:MAG: hypothetical protein PHU75_10390 [Candidatus Nanopelagicales bacterium]|nr:hypothetical protein [Candidatus Nanopelagicales bacterium]
MTTDKPISPLMPVLLSIGWALIALVAAYPTIVTVMLFDSGVENATTWMWMVFYGMWTFLFLSVLVIPVIWVVWALARRSSGGRAALVIIALVPFLALIPVVVAFFAEY